ncbi:DUF2141 domain-containing protein [Carboxylicivirga marina]|uniref:DUF2141 domain-containing protein n=1 Tax=Carboxylicivirga marina TaxID=2800988 RepID=A0ABS1HDL4_9BACT|nr:DUF2141 domain-containing protein [Carboxylicivirga marina]MBK3515726.1 DUF2141 domain-containing protein [Carboxylicivirga marina]
MKTSALKQLCFLSLFMLSAFDSPITLTIKINGLKSNEGHILIQISDVNEKAINEVKQTINQHLCTIVINDLKPGTYSYKYFHDANDNQELDTNFIGMPKEGFGFSNNAKGTFGPPGFEKTVFTLETDTTHICTIEYL